MGIVISFFYMQYCESWEKISYKILPMMSYVNPFLCILKKRDLFKTAIQRNAHLSITELEFDICVQKHTDVAGKRLLNKKKVKV